MFNLLWYKAYEFAASNNDGCGTWGEKIILGLTNYYGDEGEVRVIERFLLSGGIRDSNP